MRYTSAFYMRLSLLNFDQRRGGLEENGNPEKALWEEHHE